ncbi:Innexin unc-9 [Lamellibrachia satsuma]|nr:Innexin unc-9 [Lamellibrachia satsuma]
MPHVTETRHMISYYQWVPLILVSQALLYFLPCLFWRFLNRRIGLNLPSIIEAARATQKAVFPETREKSIRYVVMQIDSYLTSSVRRHLPGTAHTSGRCSRFARALSRSWCLACCKMYGNYLTCCYLCMKLLYLANGIGQLWLLDLFLGFQRSYQLYGIHVLAKFLRGEDWSSSERFPRVTLCDFEIRQQTNVHRYTVQCVLPINLFNEKIFIFIWFWLLAMASMSIVNIIHWLTRQTILSTQTAYVRRQLSSMDTINKREHRATREFTENYLRRDGLLIAAVDPCYVTMPPYRYTACQPFELSNASRLNTDALMTAIELGIAAKLPKRRGCRGDVRKQRIIQPVIGHRPPTRHAITSKQTGVESRSADHPGQRA